MELAVSLGWIAIGIFFILYKLGKEEFDGGVIGGIITALMPFAILGTLWIVVSISESVFICVVFGALLSIPMVLCLSCANTAIRNTYFDLQMCIAVYLWGGDDLQRRDVLEEILFCAVKHRKLYNTKVLLLCAHAAAMLAAAVFEWFWQGYFTMTFIIAEVFFLVFVFGAICLYSNLIMENLSNNFAVPDAVSTWKRENPDKVELLLKTPSTDGCNELE